jgi:hypothetical protein
MFCLVRVFGPKLSSLISHKAIIIVGPSSPTCSGRMILSKTAVTGRVKHASRGKGQYIYTKQMLYLQCALSWYLCRWIIRIRTRCLRSVLNAAAN